MFSDGNSDLLALSGTQIFFFAPYSWHVDHIISHFFTELKIYHQSLIFNFQHFLYDGSLVLKMLQNCPKLLEIKMTATCQLKRFVHLFFAVYFFQVLILVNGNLSVILSRSLALGYSYKTLYIFLFWTTETRGDKNGYLVKKILLPEIMIRSRCRNVKMKLQNNKMQGKNCNLIVGNKSVAFWIIANEQPHEARGEAARRQHD